MEKKSVIRSVYLFRPAAVANLKILLRKKKNIFLSTCATFSDESFSTNTMDPTEFDTRIRHPAVKCCKCHKKCWIRLNGGKWGGGFSKVNMVKGGSNLHTYFFGTRP